MSKKLFIKTEADVAVLLNLYSLLFVCPVDSLSSAVLLLYFLSLLINTAFYQKKKKN